MGDFVALYQELTIFKLKEILQHILLTIFLSFILLSCEKEYRVGKVKGKLTLNSTFCSLDTQWTLRLGKTANPYEYDMLSPVINASVSISSDNGVTDEFMHLRNGIYVFDYISQTDVVYKIHVICDGFDEIFAKSTIPEKDSIFLSDKELIINNEGEKNLKFTFTDSSSRESYLMIKHIVYKEIVSLNNDTIPFLDTVWIQGIGDVFEQNLPDNAITKSLFVDKKVDVKEISFQSYGGFQKNKELIRGVSKIEIYFCSKDFYEYQKSLELYKWNNHAVNTSIVNSTSLYSNIDQGLGIFAGYNKRVLIDTFK